MHNGKVISMHMHGRKKIGAVRLNVSELSSDKIKQPDFIYYVHVCVYNICMYALVYIAHRSILIGSGYN